MRENDGNRDVRGVDVKFEDETYLAVRGNFDNKDDATYYVKQLAKAATAVLLKHKVVHLRCIGAPSVNNAMKAMTIAQGYAITRKEPIAMTSDWTTVQFDNSNESRTALIIKGFVYSPTTVE
jgi:stage V sporulation protein SpoVS